MFCLFSLAGAVLAAAGRADLMLWANAAFTIGNTGLVVRNLSIREWPQAGMFGVFLVVSVYGVFRWGSV